MRRAVTNENDENIAGRLTRAKAAALHIPTEDVRVGDPPKKILAAKRSTSTTAAGAAPLNRRRAVLGDVSNVNKEVVDNKGTSKSNLVKAAKPVGVTKTSRIASTRPVLASKSVQQTSTELKRPASEQSESGHVAKKRNTSSIKEEEIESSNENGFFSLRPTSQTIHDHQPPQPALAFCPEVFLKEEEEEEVEPYFETLDDLRPRARDLDSEDLDDPLMVAEYVHEIFAYMKKLEITTLPNPNYMEYQDQLEWKMRGILVDWLLEVHTRFRLLPETLFLTVNIIDRFLSERTVQLDRLQLVGVTAMFIAAKYEEVLSPHVQNFSHVTGAGRRSEEDDKDNDDNTDDEKKQGFTEEQILSAERHMLATLEYDLSYPNPMNFLRRISKADHYDIQTRTMAKYLLEIGCLDHRFIKYPPSHVAAAAMYIARLYLERGEWVSITSSTMAVYSTNP